MHPWDLIWNNNLSITNVKSVKPPVKMKHFMAAPCFNVQTPLNVVVKVPCLNV